LTVVCYDFAIVPFIKYHFEYELQTQNHKPLPEVSPKNPRKIGAGRGRQGQAVANEGEQIFSRL